MRKILASLSIFAILFFVVLVPSTFAKVMTSEEGKIRIEESEVVDDDLFIGAKSVVIEGVVNGDVFIAAENININGTVNGNLHVVGKTIILEGIVKGNIYSGSQNLTAISSNIGGSIIAAGENINIDENTLVGGSVLTAGRSININSQIKRNVMAGAQSLVIGESSDIGKDFYYAVGSADGQASISETAVIGGEIHKADTKTAQENIQASQENISAVAARARAASNIFSYLGALIIGFIALKLFGPFMASASKKVSDSFWKSLGIGFLIIIGFIPGILILLITVIGIPLAGISILLLTLYGYLAKIVVGNALGDWFAKKFEWKNSFWVFALGLLSIYILKFIPVVGGFAGFTIFLVGFGSIVLSLLPEKR